MSETPDMEVDNQVTRQILMALLQSLPEPGAGVITGFQVRQGWADALHIDLIHAPDHLTGRFLSPAELKVIRETVSAALRPQRHSIRVVEDRVRVP